MSLLGNDYAPDPMSMGLLGMGSALMTPRAMGGGVGPGMNAFVQQAMAAQQMRRQMAQDALRERVYNAQIKNYESEAEQRRATAAAKQRDLDLAAQRERAQREVLTGIVGRGQPGFRDASIAMTGNAPAGYTSPTSRARITDADMAAWIANGGDPKQLQAIAEAGNLGLPEVARTIEGRGSDNTPQTLQFDKYGRPIGAAIPKPFEMKLQDIGGSVVPVNPYAPTAITKTMTPGDVASNSLGWANNRATLRGQDMTNERMIELAQLQREATAAQQAAAQAAAQQQRAEKGAADLAGSFQQGGLPAVYASISSLNNKLLGKKDADQVEGLGVLPSVLNKSGLTRWMLSNESKDTRSQVQAVSNDLLKMYSGLAVTLPEAERRALEMMSDGVFSAQDFANAWPRTVERFNQTVGNLTAGQSPAAVSTYSRRPGAMPTTPVAPAFKKDAAAQPATIDDLVRRYTQGQ